MNMVEPKRTKIRSCVKFNLNSMKGVALPSESMMIILKMMDTIRAIQFRINILKLKILQIIVVLLILMYTIESTFVNVNGKTLLHF